MPLDRHSLAVDQMPTLWVPQKPTRIAMLAQLDYRATQGADQEIILRLLERNL